jgi:hypothetical protein
MHGVAKDFMALQYAEECFDLSFQRLERLLEREKKPEYFKTAVPSRQFASQW